MNKSIYLIILLFTISFSYAQEEEKDTDFVSKRGENILPESGDIALGVDASPVLFYVGNIFNGTAGNNASFQFANGSNAIYAKYFLADDAAIRVTFRYGNNTFTDNEYVIKDQDIPDPFVTVTDVKVLNYCNSVLGLGYEIRRGKGRVQGFYGGMFNIGTSNTDADFTYGNAMDALNANPSSYNFGSNLANGGRVLNSTSGRTMLYSVNAFIGVEYFFAPKLSIGGEFTWGLNMSKTADGSYDVESWDFANGAQKVDTYDSAGDKNFGFDTGNVGGAIFLLFHF